MIPKFLIMADVGYGQDFEVIEAETLEDAQRAAYEKWREEAENNADYWAKPLTQEVAEEYGFEDEMDMSLRDWFAGQALCGLAAKSDLGGKWVEYAEAAYKLADAMLKRRDTNS